MGNNSVPDGHRVVPCDHSDQGARFEAVGTDRERTVAFCRFCAAEWPGPSRPVYQAKPARLHRLRRRPD